MAQMNWNNMAAMQQQQAFQQQQRMAMQHQMQNIPLPPLPPGPAPPASSTEVSNVSTPSSTTLATPQPPLPPGPPPPPSSSSTATMSTSQQPSQTESPKPPQPNQQPHQQRPQFGGPQRPPFQSPNQFQNGGGGRFRGPRPLMSFDANQSGGENNQQSNNFGQNSPYNRCPPPNQQQQRFGGPPNRFNSPNQRPRFDGPNQQGFRPQRSPFEGGRGGSANGPRGPRPIPPNQSSQQGARPGDWDCGQCGKLNFARRTDCFKCKAPKDCAGGPSSQDQENNWSQNSQPHGGGGGRPPQKQPPWQQRAQEHVTAANTEEIKQWTCNVNNCGMKNFLRRLSCFKCQSPKPGSDVNQSNSRFNQQQQPNFGNQPSQQQNQQPSNNTSEVAASPSKEQMLKDLEKFEQMFSNMENQFENWKQRNQNNPDQDYVNGYIAQMTKIKDGLIDRRTNMLAKIEQMSNNEPSSSKPKESVNEIVASTSKKPPGPPPPKRPMPTPAPMPNTESAARQMVDSISDIVKAALDTSKKLQSITSNKETSSSSRDQEVINLDDDNDVDPVEFVGGSKTKSDGIPGIGDGQDSDIGRNESQRSSSSRSNLTEDDKKRLSKALEDDEDDIEVVPVKRSRTSPEPSRNDYQNQRFQRDPYSNRPQQRPPRDGYGNQPPNRNQQYHHRANDARGRAWQERDNLFMNPNEAGDDDEDEEELFERRRPDEIPSWNSSANVVDYGHGAQARSDAIGSRLRDAYERSRSDQPHPYYYEEHARSQEREMYPPPHPYDDRRSDMYSRDAYSQERDYYERDSYYQQQLRDDPYSRGHPHPYDDHGPPYASRLQERDYRPDYRSENRYDDRYDDDERYGDRQPQMPPSTSSQSHGFQLPEPHRGRSKIEGNEREHSEGPPAVAATSKSNKNVGEVVVVDDLIHLPGRYMRPPKVVIIFRGLPGSGKSFVAKNIKSQEASYGSETPRILALDDYFECDGEVSKMMIETMTQFFTISKFVYILMIFAVK